MNQNNSSVGGNHKYLQISINTDNARDILLFLYNETKKHRQDIDTITNKIEQILKSDKFSQLDQNLGDFCTETNQKFEAFNATINSLLKNFTTHQESIKNQIEKSNNDIQKEIAGKIIDIENKIYPFSGLLSRANELQILCDQLCSDKSIIERIKKLKNMEDDIDQLQERIKKLEELQKDPSKESLNAEIDEICSEKSSSNLEISENQINNDDNSEKIQKIDDNSNENQKNDNENTEHNNNNVVSKLDLSNIKNDTPSKKKNQAPNFYAENALLQSNIPNKEKVNLNTKNDNSKASTFNYKFDSTEKHQKHEISNDKKENENENEKNESKKNSQKTETKTDVKQSKDSSTKNDDIFNRMNRKNKKEKSNTTGTPALNPKPNKNQPNVNSKTASLQNDSGKEKHRKFLTTSTSSPTKNYTYHQTDFQKSKDNKKEEEDENENIVDELRSLKDLLSLQSKQLSLLMEPDSLLISTIAKIVSEMLEQRKNEIDDNNEAKLQHFCGEMKRNIDSMRSQVETANEKISRCATKSELINVADDLLNSNVNDSQNTAIGATSMCRCLACGKPRSSVSTLSRMGKVNSPLFLDRNLHTLLNYKNLSETTTNLYQSQNSNPGARVKLLIAEKSSPF